MLRVKSVETAFQAVPNQYVQGALDVLGIFDNVIQPVFPYPFSNIALIFSFEKMDKPTVFEIRINAPDDTLISQGEFGVMPDAFGNGRKIVNLSNFLVAERGLYTVDILEKVAEDKVNFISTEELFMADYPPKRRWTEEEIQEILATEGVIKMVKTDYKPVKYIQDESLEPIHFQLFLDPNEEIEEGFVAFPENDKIEIRGEIFDLTGIRRQIEWMFGQEIPKETGEEQENAQEMQELTENKE
ncbi:DUF6941 family protein [Fusobacterium necrophorum]|uniref:Uncharacterized protein n=1 Tax=Fusobacterium necrophorum subsp. funduliforme TaxID=143387 RepID=A0A162ITM6_9FUSO|nr:hypothetical protein [Fusobacterium necrophorum]EHO21524.1 hypothetical protein HMPREF9466_00381 [Fusobacterium necrophorum subsp. funduliforme 1_1_36S]AVQ20862.1 hypothetical protein C4N15_04070 [Fusobacterium necrophorum subsp. funduliforme]AYV92493.1 hypothetical protein BSQ88_01860 [Fusobacterium necrophorum subsp. funduliforme]EIJ69278.1 hypothetical protein HMPREF1049_0766 [Fusobacterium necrophorum subsp. funduliforme ATCC 51357]KAB0553243.1 hypothetical protein F7P76_05290 [Fusobact